MRKVLFSLFLACAMVLTMSACGSEPAAPQTTTVAEVSTRSDVPAQDEDLALPVGSTKPATQDGESETVEQGNDTAEAVKEGMGPLFQKYVRDRVQSGSYTVRYNQSGMRMVTSIDGKNSAIESDTAGILQFTLIHKDNEYYMVMPSTKKYVAMTAEDYQKQVDSLADSPLKTEGMVLKEQGEETIGGKTYSTEVYNEKSRGQVTYYFDDTGLRRAKIKKDGKISNIETFEVITGVDASAFEIPAGYTLVSDPGQLFA